MISIRIKANYISSTVFAPIPFCYLSYSFKKYEWKSSTKLYLKFSHFNLYDRNIFSFDVHNKIIISPLKFSIYTWKTVPFSDYKILVHVFNAELIVCKRKKKKHKSGI